MISYPSSFPLRLDIYLRICLIIYLLNRLLYAMSHFYLLCIYLQALRGDQELVGVYAIATVMRISRLLIAVVISFSVSAILVILGDVLGSFAIPITIFSSHIITLTGLGKYAMIVGFGFLAFGIIWLVRDKATIRWVRSQKG